MTDDANMVKFLCHITPAGKQWLEEAARIRTEPQARTLRAMMSFAARFMPTHWQPSDDPVDEPGTEPDRALVNPIDPVAITTLGRQQRADKLSGFAAARAKLRGGEK